MREKSVLHLCIHKRLKDNSKMGYLSTENFFIIVGRLYHLEKHYVREVLVELFDLGLVEWDGKDKRFLKVLG